MGGPSTVQKQYLQGQKYSVTPHPISTLLAWVQSGEIAIPEIQRPFVWDATKVRNLLDSLYEGFPVGYLISWKNPMVRLKDGSRSDGKRILIDGQQRVTALMAALLGREVLTKDYERTRIRIAFHPVEQKFEVSNPAIEKDSAWISDIAAVFNPATFLFDLVKRYATTNASVSEQTIFRSLESLKGVLNNQIGLIELSPDLEIETVTEIFIRINSEGMVLSQADFAMSKIATNETYGGSTLRKAIDYFCHMAVSPEFYKNIVNNDPEFIKTGFFSKMSWLKSENDDIYDPSYADMLRVAFTVEFRRGRLQDLVALLSGRNFETKQYEEPIAADSFARLTKGVESFINEQQFKRFVMIVRSAGFVLPELIAAQNALNFAYILYLTLRGSKEDAAHIEKTVRKWLVMSLLTGRYSGSAETTIDSDIRRINETGAPTYLEEIERAQLSAAFWDAALPQAFNSSSSNNPQFKVFLAAQVKAGDKGFLSRDITVTDLLLNRGDYHHVFPKEYLKGLSLTKGRYNQVANFAVTQTEINIAIGKKAPSHYFKELIEQCNGAKLKYGAITELEELRGNMKAHCIPEDSALQDDYDAFLEKRRKLMAEKLRKYYNAL